MSDSVKADAVEKNTTILMVIAPEQFRDEELQVPRQILEQAGCAVDIASTQTGCCTGMLGAVETATMDLNVAQEQVKQGVYKGIVVVGGMGSPQYLWSNDTLHQILKELDSQRAIISAICLSGVVLAKAGLLNQKKATVWHSPESMAQFAEYQVEYTGEPVTVEGNIVTANGPDAAKAFGETLVACLQKRYAHA
jgi:protease I